MGWGTYNMGWGTFNMGWGTCNMGWGTCNMGCSTYNISWGKCNMSCGTGNMGLGTSRKSRYFRWRRWGSSRLGLRTLDPPLSPHHQWKKFGACVWIAKISDKFSRHFKQFLALFVFSEKKNLKNGPLFSHQILFFSSGRKKKKRKTPLTVDT
jgi:hypothetical protein